ncbi:MAG: hypothetical protein ABR567_14920 [Myxococcales bacterium]|nr:hypothetical protein [Myxococcales bacterium]
MTRIAQELSRRASPRYIGQQAKETALNKTHQWKEQITSSPLALGLIGGALGAAIGGALAKARRSESDYRTDLRYRRVPRYDEDFGGENETSGVGERLAERAQDLKERAGEVVSNVREHIPSASDIGEKVDENPMLVALGGLALGAVAALLLPVTRKERELLDPVKQRAGEAIGTLGEKIGDTVQQAKDKIAGEQNESSKVPDFPPQSFTH